MDQPDEPDTPEPDSTNREAAKYRRKLRDTEHQRDALASTLTQLQRSRVEAVAASHGVTPTALWAAGTELADLLDEDGNPDTDRIQTAVQHCYELLGITPKEVGIAGLHSGVMRPPPAADRWRDAFTPQNFKN